MKLNRQVKHFTIFSPPNLPMDPSPHPIPTSAAHLSAVAVSTRAGPFMSRCRINLNIKFEQSFIDDIQAVD